jgi:hypothetical protein
MQYGVVNCTVCPAGFQCFDPAAAPEECGYGRANAEGSASNCTKCGKYDFYAEDSTEAVVTAGYSDVTTGDACKACLPGQYAPWHGDLMHPSDDDNPVLEPSACLPCPAGFECGDMGLTKPINCSMDFWSKEGMGPCEACPLFPANWANIGPKHESRADPRSGECYTYERKLTCREICPLVLFSLTVVVCPCSRISRQLVALRKPFVGQPNTTTCRFVTNTTLHYLAMVMGSCKMCSRFST